MRAAVLELCPVVSLGHRDVPPDAVKDAVAVLKAGGVIAFPTDTLYGIGCAYSRRRAIERILRLRGIDRTKRPLTFMLPDLGELARYAEVSEIGRIVLSRIFPGPYCVELIAQASVPDPFVVGGHRAIGVRIPDHRFCEQVMWGLGEPLLTATAKSTDGRILTTAIAIQDALGPSLDRIFDGGVLEGLPSTVLSLVDDWPTLLRQGRGASGPLLP